LPAQSHDLRCKSAIFLNTKANLLIKRGHIQIILKPWNENIPEKPNGLNIFEFENSALNASSGRIINCCCLIYHHLSGNTHHFAGC
jgi:hypothetical protein